MRGRDWRRVLWVTVATAGLAGLLAWWLFSGSGAGCERTGTEAAPELRCSFEVAASRQEVWAAPTAQSIRNWVEQTGPR